MCSCKQVKFRQISFERTPKSTDYPIEGLYLNRWPYIHHGPGEHNQLSNMVTAISNLRQQQQQMIIIIQMNYVPFASKINTLIRNAFIKS